MSGSAPLSVVHVLWSGEVGGIGRIVHDLALEQRASGLHVAVAFGQAAGPFTEGMKSNGLPCVDFELSSGYDVRPQRIGRAAKRLCDFDVIHLHAFNAPLALAAVTARTRIVFTDHGSVLAGRRVTVADRILLRARAQFLRQSCDVIAANSHWTAEQLHQKSGIERHRISVVHNGVQIPTKGTLASPGLPSEGELVVAYVGRLAAFKRVDRLLRGLNHVGENGAIRTLVVGSGPLESDLKALATSLGLDRVEFLGYRSDVEDILEAVDVLVQPSEGEPFGLAVIEACRSGALPVVFADGGGATEVLPPDGVTVADAAELGELLKGLCRERAPLSQGARAARLSWVRERFSLQATAAGYRELYARAIPPRTHVVSK